MKKLEFNKIAVWFAICLLVFIFSTFLHECGHGLANKINGVSVSTGFNRVGNAFRYPFDSDFRTGECCQAYGWHILFLLFWKTTLTILFVSIG